MRWRKQQTNQKGNGTVIGHAPSKHLNNPKIQTRASDDENQPSNRGSLQKKSPTTKKVKFNVVKQYSSSFVPTSK